MRNVTIELVGDTDDEPLEIGFNPAQKLVFIRRPLLETTVRYSL